MEGCVLRTVYVFFLIVDNLRVSRDGTIEPTVSFPATQLKHNRKSSCRTYNHMTNNQLSSFLFTITFIWDAGRFLLIDIILISDIMNKGGSTPLLWQGSLLLSYTGRVQRAQLSGARQQELSAVIKRSSGTGATIRGAPKV
jgi:hypothetical protein